MSFWILLLYCSKLNCEEMSLALNYGACCVKICSLGGRLHEVFVPSFFWRKERPRVMTSHHNQRQQRPFGTSERTTNSNRPTPNGCEGRWNLTDWPTTRLHRSEGGGGVAEPGDPHVLHPVSSDPLSNETLKSLLRFSQRSDPEATSPWALVLIGPEAAAG